jgi:hypothetical protein
MQDQAGSAMMVPPSNQNLPRLGLRNANLKASLRWQSIFEPDLVLTREHCEISASPLSRRETTNKVPGKLFPDACNKCAFLYLRAMPMVWRCHWHLEGCSDVGRAMCAMAAVAIRFGRWA